MDSGILKVLLDVSRQLAETRTLEPLLDYAVDISLELLNGEYGFLVLLREDGSLDFRVKRHRTRGEIGEAESQISRTILDKVLQDGESVVTASAVNDPVFGSAASVEGLQLNSVLCVPLISRGHTIGALYLENRHHENVFMRDDLEPLEYFGYQAAVAIENAMLNDELETRIARRTAELEVSNEQLQREIRERHRAEQRLIELAVEQERVKLLSNFIQDASHQFRTPLTHINMNVDLMSRKYPLPDSERYYGVIRDQVDVIVRLVESLVFMAELDRGVQQDMQIVDMTTLIHELVETYQPQAERKHQILDVALNATDLKVMGNAGLLFQALRRVLENALQYSADDEGKIALSLDKEGRMAVVTIQDNGIGISQEDQVLVFTRFYRADKAGTTKGLGLGLTIARKVIEQFDGQISLESNIGVGSVVTISLPIAD